MKSLFAAVALAGLLLGSSIVARAQDEQYVQIYNLIQEADSYNHSGEAGRALSKYLEARTALQQFQKVYPAWNPRIVNFRLNYLADRIAAIPAPKPAPAASAAAGPGTNAAAAAAPPPGERAELENQLTTLRNQVQRLQADRMVLEARLKEALSAQPAAIDPRELARAEERIRSLEKDNSLLQVTLAQQARTGPTPDTQTAQQLKDQLAEANHKLAEQTEKAQGLEREKLALQTRLDGLIPAAAAASAGQESTRNALAEANRKLAAQTELASQLSREKESLLARVKQLETDAETLDALHRENEILKKQLADLKPRAAAEPAADTERELAAARAQLAALQSDNEILRLEKIALQNRIRQASAPPEASPVFANFASPSADAKRVQQLERERADLQKKLEEAQRELYGRNSRGAAAQIEDLKGQLQVLRARLAVLEAPQVPYSAAELALLKTPETTLPAAGAAGTRPRPVSELPAGSATLVAEARRDFAAKRYDQAEAKYLQILSQDQKNVYTLANLATIQLELNRLDDAEKHVSQAIALAPDDAYSLLVLGEVKFRREQYDAALDALSRAAKLEPQNPEIQNYLGMTLSQKGLRKPAETAFRKAIQLDPNYASANNNLAVFYLTAKPPWVELARWHYQKALAAGLPRNPELEKMLETETRAEAGK